MGAFIVIEGVEGAGKSTQARLLHRNLQRLGYPCLLTREPGGTPLGERVRRVLKAVDDITPLSELFLFLSARHQLVTKVIRPALREGRVVVCDRFSPSTLAYQAQGRGLDPAEVRRLNRLATGGLEPDLVVLLDITPQEGLRRGGRHDPFEREGLDFHRLVRQAYLEQARADPARWLVVDATLPVREIARQVLDRALALLGEKGIEPSRPSS